MGIGMGFYHPEWTGSGETPWNVCFKKKNRWKFIIKDVSGDGVNSLPPFRGGKPSISFKEMSAEHLNETIFFPSKPDWKPITLTLYDIVKEGENPVFSWLRRAYDPKNCSLWNPSLQTTSNGLPNVIGSLKCAQCFLNMYNGCGDIIEQWVFEHAWPQSVEFADGDMSSSEIITCDLTLRYDRAYIQTPDTAMANSMSGNLPSYTCTSIPISNIPLSMINVYSVEAPEFMVIRPPENIRLR